MPEMLGFTGTRNCTVVQVMNVIGERWNWLTDMRGFVTGGCRGFDAYVGEMLFRIWPEKQHWVIVPANHDQVDFWWRQPHIVEMTREFPHALKIMQMPEGSSYKDRNQRIVELCDSLFYMAEYPEDDSRSRRSGTWQTVRLGRAATRAPVGVIINE
jgi:hypothetical protein